MRTYSYSQRFGSNYSNFLLETDSFASAQVHGMNYTNPLLDQINYFKTSPEEVLEKRRD